MYKLLLILALLFTVSCDSDINVIIEPYECIGEWIYDETGNAITDVTGIHLRCESIK